MRPNRLFFVTLLGAALSSACVADRPSRNSVFNENQYLRKEFLVKAGGAPASDPGYLWRFQAVVTDVSSPNPLAGLGLQPGANNGSDSRYTTAGPSFVRFTTTQDTLRMIDVREISAAQPEGRVPQVLDAWPVTHVDLKYRINLDGEKTNEYIENQELDWQARQWVKVNFAKNDMADLVSLGSVLNAQVAKCTNTGDAAASLVPGSFSVDEAHGYMEWGVEITLPINFSDATCALLFGQNGVSAQRIGRQNETIRLKYSFARTDKYPTAAYAPMVLDEKDPIRHKYGVFTQASTARDPDSGLLAARELAVRWNPARTDPAVWYFDPGFPAAYKDFFNGPGGIKERTNKLLADAGAALRFDFKDAPDGVHFGDARYSWLYWISDKDSATGFAGLTEQVVDPISGEMLASNILFNDFEIKETYVQRINAFLKTVGAIDDVNATSWKDAPDGASASCQDGQTQPLVTDNVRKLFNAQSTLFTKMSALLTPTSGTAPASAGPYDFVPAATPDFLDAYYAALPYTVFREPGENVFVTPEGGSGTHTEAKLWEMTTKEVEFRKLAAQIDQGMAPFDDSSGASSAAAARDYVARFHDLTQNHQSLQLARDTQARALTSDAPTAFSFDSVMARSARHCVGGHWETKGEWQDRLISTYWRAVAWHEFGHALGLRHNFMGSIDWKNFPMVTVPGADGKPVTRPAVASSSVMEYNSTPDRVFWEGGWGPYDQGALSFLYANTAKTADAPSSAVSGQVSATAPWKDPKGFTADGKEIPFLFCTDEQVAISPFCQRGDLGTRPSEIIANAIEAYEWQYQWRNFRMSRKLWDLSAYPDFATNFVTNLRAFIPIQRFDWAYTLLPTKLRQIGVQAPAGTNALQYFLQLSGKFTQELSVANQLAAAFHLAIVTQGSGERPYKTVYDKYNGDVTQQGIILDKVYAIQGFSDLWYMENYDRNLEGAYVSAFGSFIHDGLDGKDGQYNALADKVISTMLGGAYDVYSFQQTASVAAFAAATQRVEFASMAGRPEVRDWIGSVTFTRDVDFLEFFRSLAAQYQAAQTACPGGKYCNYDPRARRAFDSDTQLSDEYNEFVGPDGRRYIWMYIQNRHQWVVADRDRNIATYQAIRNWTELVVRGEGDGSEQGANTSFTYEKQVKTMVDLYAQYN